MALKRNKKSFLLLVLNGIAMGTANKIPGVSGGAVAFVVGFYEELIYSLQKFNRKAFALLTKRGFSKFYQYINGKFLIAIFSGTIISFFTVSKGLDFLLNKYELNVWGYFFGLILGSIYFVSKEFKDWNFKTFLSLLIGISIGISFSFITPSTENDNLFFVFFCGIISVSGMTLPGLSGSFILMAMGNYVMLMVDSVNALYDIIFSSFQFNFSWINNSETIRLLKILIVFVFGSVIGLISLSHILGYLLKRYHQMVIASIIGIITSSLGIVWPWKEKLYLTDDMGSVVVLKNGHRVVIEFTSYLPELNNTNTITTIIIILLGVITVIALERLKPKVIKN
ncbi:MAG: DUF368 domain-containing protein [Ichthyobacteriaceae bacterium]|nr:DUF368 domain-containing protein [Ichthyobacteriaceae bacterium]